MMALNDASTSACIYIYIQLYIYIYIHMHTYHHIMSIPMDNMDVDFLRIEKKHIPVGSQTWLAGTSTNIFR